MGVNGGRQGKVGCTALAEGSAEKAINPKASTGNVHWHARPGAEPSAAPCSAPSRRPPPPPPPPCASPALRACRRRSLQRVVALPAAHHPLRRQLQALALLQAQHLPIAARRHALARERDGHRGQEQQQQPRGGADRAHQCAARPVLPSSLLQALRAVGASAVLVGEWAAGRARQLRPANNAACGRQGRWPAAARLAAGPAPAGNPSHQRPRSKQARCCPSRLYPTCEHNKRGLASLGS